MRIDHEGIVSLPDGATHIYTAILHPDVQKMIKQYNGDAMNVYVKETRVYIPRRDGKFHCLLLVTY